MEHTSKNSYFADMTISDYFEPNERIFTRREMEILYCITNGFTIKEIACRLFVSESTIANHRKNMLKKSKTRNIVSLMNFAIKNNVL